MPYILVISAMSVSKSIPKRLANICRASPSQSGSEWSRFIAWASMMEFDTGRLWRIRVELQFVSTELISESSLLTRMAEVGRVTVYWLVVAGRAWLTVILLGTCLDILETSPPAVGKTVPSLISSINSLRNMAVSSMGAIRCKDPSWLATRTPKSPLMGIRNNLLTGAPCK